MSNQSKRNNSAMMELNAYLNSLPTDVNKIDVSSFSVNQIPDLSRFTHVLELRCVYNFSLDHITSLPKTLKILCLNLNQNLTSLPTLPDSLEELYCRGCLLTTLPTLPNTLKVLDCSNNIMLSSLPNLPDILERLLCYNDALTSLPTLPSALKIMQCNDNGLTSLPNLPDTLELLHVNNNELIALPNLPPNLKTLDCSKNRLTHLPNLPICLDNLFCHHNQLWHFPPLDDHIQLYCRNNPIYERIGRITDMSNVSEYDYTYTDIIKYKKLMIFQELYYLSKCKRKIQQWLLRSKEKEIMAKYKPENLFRILEETEDWGLQDALDTW